VAHGGAYRDGMGINITNIFCDLPDGISDELVETLAECGPVRIERIVSCGQASPPGFWYDQEQHEWVIVLKGAARLRFEDQTIEMKPGDFVNVPAHKKHRVDWTSPDELTIWLAVHYGDCSANG
jgi:cupin 2 domain-containing protein